jgi:hypothetical protein
VPLDDCQKGVAAIRLAEGLGHVRGRPLGGGEHDDGSQQSIWIRIDAPHSRQCRRAPARIRASVSKRWQDWRFDRYQEGMQDFQAKADGVTLWGTCFEPGSIRAQRAAKHDGYDVRMER